MYDSINLHALMWHGKQEMEGILYLMRLLGMSNKYIIATFTGN